MTSDEGGLTNLCAVRNGCSRRVLRWAVEDHLRTALSMTMRGMLPRKVVFHTDRGALSLDHRLIGWSWGVGMRKVPSELR